MRRIAGTIALGLLSCSRLTAQETEEDRARARVAAPTGADPADSAGNAIVHGVSDMAMRNTLTQMRATRQVQDNCWKMGCLLILNESRNYSVIGFYLDTARAGETQRWTRNQLSAALPPMKATLRFKSGQPDTCNLPLRLVLRRLKTKDEVEVFGAIGLCSTPHQHTLLHIKVAEPSVTVLPVEGDQRPAESAPGKVADPARP